MPSSGALIVGTVVFENAPGETPEARAVQESRDGIRKVRGGVIMHTHPETSLYTKPRPRDNEEGSVTGQCTHPGIEIAPVAITSDDIRIADAHTSVLL